VSYNITILAERDNWMTPYARRLADDWGAEGHRVVIAHAANEDLRSDFCFCLSFGHILSAKVLRNFKNTLVVHASALPNGRGWSPMVWQILEGANEIPITLLEAAEPVDSGDIYLQSRIQLTGDELVDDWRRLIGDRTISLCKDWIRGYPAVLSGARSQFGRPTYYGRRNSNHSELDPNKTIADQFNLLRVVDNERYPAFFIYHGKKFKLKIESMD
jgi:methionyl-tRNA formyltransferase